MHIIQEIQQLIWSVVKFALLMLGLLLVAAIAPAILAVLPQILIAQNPQGDFAWLCWVFVIVTPLTVALWMAFLTHWHEIRLAQREGRLDAWREENGLLQRNIEATGFMFLGLFGSVACEFLFSYAFYRLVPYEGAARFHLWFALFPFAAYAPVILLCVCRWLRNRKIRSFTSQPSSALPEQIAKAVEEGDTQQIIKIAKRGPTAAALLGQALEDHYTEKAEMYRKAAQSLSETNQEEERRETNGRELELMNRIDGQITRIRDSGASGTS
jgi:hypothetical protein